MILNYIDPKSTTPSLIGKDGSPHGVSGMCIYVCIYIYHWYIFPYVRHLEGAAVHSEEVCQDPLGGCILRSPPNHATVDRTLRIKTVCLDTTRGGLFP